MINVRPDGHKRSAKQKNVRQPEIQVPDPDQAVFEVERSGLWKPAQELLTPALKSLGEGKNVTFNRTGVEHIKASALRVLRALDLGQKKRGRYPNRVNVLAHFRQRFDDSGWSGQFSVEEAHDE